MAERILIIDDDRALADMVSTYLGKHGFEPSHRARAGVGLLEARTGGYDAVILDLMLPDGDGLDLCRSLRAESDVPILMLTARGDELDRIVGLELGADDYLPKPFHPRELLARLRAILRRSRPSGPTRPLRFGTLEIDRAARRVRVSGSPTELTARQYEILVALAERPGRVLSREQLTEIVLGDELEPYDRSIDVHISRIRAAIEPDPKQPARIKTVRGMGYLFTEDQP